MAIAAREAKNNKKTSRNKIKLTRKHKIWISVCAGVLAIAIAVTAILLTRLPRLDEEMKDRFVYLIEESKDMNTVFFGAGLPVYYRENALSDRLGVYYNDEPITYNKVSEFSSYQYIDDIKKKAESIYTEKYLSALYETAFDGVMTGNSSAYLRFYEQEDTLYQSMLAKDFGVNERIYDYSTMKIVRPSNKTYVNIVIESYTLNDPTRVSINLSFNYERGNWYLDSPTD